MTEANAVLARFASQIRWITDSILGSFELEPHQLDDLRQDAAILVLSYAGVIPGTHYGKLAEIEKVVKGDEPQVRKVLAYRLRKDLSQQVMRMQGKIPPVADQTIDQLLDTDKEPSVASHETESDNRMDEARLLRKYPTFARNVLDNVSQTQLAVDLGVSLPTVERRIRGEKRSYLSTRLRQRGIVVEGDEDMAELEEAFGYTQTYH